MAASVPAQQKSKILEDFRALWTDLKAGQRCMPHVTGNHILLHLWTYTAIYVADSKDDHLLFKCGRVATLFFFGGICAKFGLVYNISIAGFYGVRLIFMTDGDKRADEWEQEAKLHAQYALIDAVMAVANSFFILNLAGSLLIGCRPRLITDPENEAQAVLRDATQGGMDLAMAIAVKFGFVRPIEHPAAQNEEQNVEVEQVGASAPA